MPKGLRIEPPNAMGVAVAWLHYTADPALDPDNPETELAERARRWMERQRALFPDPNDWAREYELNFWVGVGTRVFPQFTEAMHVRPVRFNRYRVLYRGWDFGWHAPACLVAQVDGRGRLLILREILKPKSDTRDFAQHVIAQCAAAWPNHVPGYEDYCDPAGQQTKSIESERSERRDVEVLQNLGIYPKYEHGWSRKDGRALIHQLLAPKQDGDASLWVDPAGCPTLCQAFLGRYVYPTRKDGSVAEEPDDDTHPYADVMAALRYLVTGLHWKLGLRRLQPTAPHYSAIYHADQHGYGTPRRRT